MSDYGHDEVMGDLEQVKYCGLDDSLRRIVDRLDAYISRLESDNAALLEVAKDAESVRLTKDCSEYYTCDGDWIWEGGDNPTPEKPMCPWIVRPGECQPEVAMWQLADSLDSLPDHVKEALR